MKMKISILAALLGALMSGCQTAPQAGTYTGFECKLGKTTLTVKSGGTISERYGPLSRAGIWTAVSEIIVKAEVQGMEKHPSTRYYLLSKEDKTYQWSYSLEELRQKD